MTFEIDISNGSSDQSLNLDALCQALRHGLSEERVVSAVLSVSVTDNKAIHAINREYLGHDYPTDVISFQLEWSHDSESSEDMFARPEGRSAGASIEGEIVVCHEYAADQAQRGRWSTEDELTLYAIHGMLHICGYDDLTQAEKQIMRSRERSLLSGLGLNPHYPDDDLENNAPSGSDSKTLLHVRSQTAVEGPQ